MGSETILIVDDNQPNLRLMQAILECERFEVKSASDAEEALNLLKDWRPRLILMDIQLPGINGLELTRRLKQNPLYKKVVIVALTAYAMKGDAEKALAAGCDGYISKPVDTRTLPATIEGYLELAKNRRGRARAERKPAKSSSAAPSVRSDGNP